MSSRPNILMIMADQLPAASLPAYGHPVVRAPHLQRLADEGVVFEDAYCNSPLCGPSRASMMTGRLPSRIGAFDNACEFPASAPTYAHYLRNEGYRTCLSGKMHFVGPDQLHGFEERLTTDIYPSDFGWVPDWERPERRFSWYQNMLSVVQAGVCTTTNQLDYDEEVGFRAVRHLHDMARDDDERPFCMVASFTHPHDPFAITREYWDRYDHDEIDLPDVGPVPPEELDPHSRRLHHVCGLDRFDQTEERVRTARHAYYGMISYVDDKVGQLLRTLDETGMAEDTIVVFTSDHGEMLGERGLWYKMSFFDRSARIPLIVHAPDRFAPRRASAAVSLVDLLPTLVDFATDGERPEFVDEPAGQSLVPLLEGDDERWSDAPVLGELLGEGAVAPHLMIRRGRYKYVHGDPDPEQLFDLENDPGERMNLASRPEHEDVRAAFAEEVRRHWDVDALHDRVVRSQRRRRIVQSAIMTGRHTPWDFQPTVEASRQYMRNHLTLNDLERRARLPWEEPPEAEHGGGEI